VNDDQSSSAGDELGWDLMSTIQHITLLREREVRLQAARLEAQNQLFHRIGSMHRCGEISDVKLIAIYERVKVAAALGSRKAWDLHVSIKWAAMKYLPGRLPNGPEGTWVGVNPCEGTDPAPHEGVPVVYVLFDSMNEPCYVGSTENLRQRIKAHATNGKVVARWQAHPCRDREHAYEVEDRLLKEHKPHLNIRAGR
jgi:predicted GIY-YIG superfamily endonuclease